MIIEGLLNVVYSLFALLLSPINIPAMPEEVRSFISDALGYIKLGIGLLANWTDLEYLLALFALVLAVDVGILLYKAIMWFIKKIPMLGIE